jgi:hypothetical protein
MIKYICDDCQAELGEYDYIASQLDMTGHTYCRKCLPNHANHMPYSWHSMATEKKKAPYVIPRPEVKP